MMKKVSVISKKFNGSLRDECETFLYGDNGQSITLFSPVSTEFFDYRKNMSGQAPDGLIEIFFKDKWFNVWHICEQHSNVNLIYVNIAMPATFQGACLEWVDLDLDYRLHLNYKVERLDEDEFEENIKQMNYPDEVIEKARAACQEVEAGLARQTFPFNYNQQVELYQHIKNASQQ